MTNPMRKPSSSRVPLKSSSSGIHQQSKKKEVSFDATQNVNSSGTQTEHNMSSSQHKKAISAQSTSVKRKERSQSAKSQSRSK